MIEQYTGIQSDFIIIGLLVFSLILLILCIVALVKIGGLNKKYESFMRGKNAKSLEDTILYRLEKMDDLEAKSNTMERDIETLNTKVRSAVQKVGLVKYDAFEELGGKLSYTIALLDERNNGCVINNVHSREGSYSYMKEIIDGNSVIAFLPKKMKR
jgi:hypothetical protein